MAQTLVLANQKGGVGKTTTTVNLAASLAAMEQRVLVIDCDPQANASSGLGVDVGSLKKSVYQALFTPEKARAIIRGTDMEYLRILPSTPDLVGAEIELNDAPNREFILRAIVDTVTDEYDYILIDCPPSLGLITINALSAAKWLLVPLQCEYYALEGIAHLMKTHALIQERLNPNLEILGILLTMFDKRNKLSFMVEREVRDHFGELVFATTIPRNVRLSEAPSHGLPAILYDIRSLGTQSYITLAQELMENTRLQPQVQEA
ncbi:MAG: ParA family protein [Deltaproteobacteria bacterium]|nr:ParA family protein [Deltaproteobacteria bacterium]